ncbi:uncharacterized protein LOC133888089 [Phragmites australis]|uniref:uncharacterized protein LOC133888089 n=1 Tax=Phragmites australis TaxID=29695 RepID=UPI002D766761|nr:uncharacterized protein LOC133888089 [Phragmites australis]
MAEALALDPAQDPDAPLDAAAIRSRLEQLSQSRRGGEEAPAAEEADAVPGLGFEYEVALQAVDEWDSNAAAIATDDLDAYLEWLRKEVSLAEEKNQKLFDEIGVVGETADNDMIQLDADIEALESSLWKLDSNGLSHLEGTPVAGLSDSTDSCRNQSNVDKDYKYEVLELDHQVGKSDVGLKLLQNLQCVKTWWQLESMLSEAKVLDFKDNCLRVSLKAPILTPDYLIYGQLLDCSVDESFVSNHELLIEVDGNMEPKKVQIFPSDVCVDKLIERLKSSREITSAPSLGWLIRQFQHQIIINTLRRSLVNDANNSRHSFEYVDKDDTIVAHLVGGIDALIKISGDWPLSSNGLKLISIRNSGNQQMHITFSLLCKAKELANGLELETRRHLVRFIDAVEDILVREMQSELRSATMSS